ncbi:MAG: glycosyltransferase family 2 protein [Verrucomicrobiae bacterium]|nr:glycosyltransferase family 2 protein [Verrucomicrobiae bacterium]
MIPFHNEEACAKKLIDECLAALELIPKVRAEIIAIDDGSQDSTLEILKAASRADARIEVIHFPHNRGQAPALYYGLKHASGEIVVTLDGDGQNNPADIPALLARLKETDADLVSGVRANRQDSRLRKFLSRFANRVRGSILNDGVTDSGCALKAFRRSVIHSLIPIRTLYSFIPALAKAGGHVVTECPVDHRSRDGGISHYGLGPFLWRPALDMIGVWWFTRRSFTTRNLR